MKQVLVIAGPDGLRRRAVSTCAGVDARGNPLKTLVVSGDGRPTPRCCDIVIPTCDCNGQPGCSSRSCVKSAGGYTTAPGGGVRTIYEYRYGAFPKCCGPDADQHSRHRYIRRGFGAGSSPCAGQLVLLIDISILWDGFQYVVTERHLEVIGTGCTLSDLSGSQTVPIAYGPCVLFGESTMNLVGPFDATSATQVRGKFRRDCSSIEGWAAWLNGPGTVRYESEWQAYLEPNNAACVSGECRRSCCLPNGSCIDGLTAEQCKGLGGSPNPVGAMCFQTDCGMAHPDMGACCDPLTGGCVNTRPEDCLLPRIFRGLRTACASVVCPAPMGACCFGSGNSQCSVTTQAQCGALNGNWHGAGTACDSGTCTSPRACCLPDGSCQNLQPEACLLAGGAGGAPSSSCGAAGFSCVGACCCNTGHGRVCGLDTRQGCLTGGCDFYGEGTVCEPNTCTIPPGGFRRQGRIFVPDRTLVVAGSGVGVGGGCAGCGGEVGGF